GGRAAEAAIGAQTEVRYEFARHRQPFAEARHAVDHPEIDACITTFEAGEGRIECVVRTVERRNMNPVRSSAGRSNGRVDEIDSTSQIRWREGGPAAEGPETKMKAKGRLGRQQRRQSPDGCDVRLDRSLARRIARLAVDRQQLAREIPLDGKVARGNTAHDELDLGLERFFESRANLVDVAGLGEIQRSDHAVDHRNRDLKAQIGGEETLLAERAENEIRAGRVARVAEPETRQTEADLLHARPHAELPALSALGRQQLLDAVDCWRAPHCFEVGVSVEQQISEAIHP